MNPTLAVASALVESGVSVRVVVAARFAGEVADTGAVPVCPDREHEAWSPPSWGPRQLVALALLRVRRWQSLRAVVDTCVREFVEFAPDLVVVDSMHRAPAGFAARSSIPVAWLCTTHAMSRLPGTVVVNALPELQPRQFDERYHYVGPLLSCLPGAEPDNDGERLLVVSPGTVFARNVRFFRGVIREFADTEWTVLIATGHLDPGELGLLPGNVHATRWIAQRSVLGRATVFVTHGGMNSVQEALQAGVPMLLAPRNREQRLTTRRLVDLQLGLPAKEPMRQRADQVAADPRVRRAMAMMRERMAARDAPRLAAEVLLHSVLAPDV